MKNSFKKLTYSALLFAMAYVLPFLTMNIPEIGSMLCQMHIPVLICGFVCGPLWGAAVGASVPIVRSLTVFMPPLYPDAAAMAFELAAYGILTGIFYRIFPKKTGYIYVTLIISMIGGRIVWGAARYVMSVVSATKFGFAAFWTGAVITALPGSLFRSCSFPQSFMRLIAQGLSSMTK